MSTTRTVLDFEKDHPERLEDEVYLGNFHDRDGEYHRIGWKTKRKGNVALDTRGLPLGERWPKAFPVFVKQEEINKENPAITKKLLP